MKKILIFLLVVTQIAIFFPILNTSIANAEHISPTETPCSNYNIDTQRCPDNNTASNTQKVETTVSNTVKYALIAIGALSGIFLIYGGMLFVLSSGNPDKVKKAKNTVLFSLIGLALAISANVIINVIINASSNTFK